MEINNGWIRNYITNINLTKINWIKLDLEQLEEFYKENYWDDDTFEYVCQNDCPSPLGLHYLSLDLTEYKGDYNFLLGIVPNNVGKKTIVAAMVYLDNHFVFTDQKVPVTYISSVEVNSYFRNKGLYKQLCEVTIDFISPNQHILISEESEMGKICKVLRILKETLVRKGFKNTIWADCYSTSLDPEFPKTIKGKCRVLDP